MTLASLNLESPTTDFASSRPLKILVYTHHYRTEPIGIGAYTGEMAEWLAARGHNVSVVTPPPHYPQWAVELPYRQWQYKVEKIAKVEITRCPIWVPFKPRGWQRVLSLLVFAVFSFPVVIREMSKRPDIAFVVEPSFLDTVVCLLLSKCFDRVCWLHIQDFEIDLAFEMGQLRRSRLRSLIHRMESRVMRGFDVVSTISKRMLARVKEKGVDPQRAVLFPNWVDTSQIFPLEHESPMRQELGIGPDRVVALFSGTLGTKQSVETLIEAAILVKEHAQIEFIICGNGADALKALAAGLPNIRFLPLQPLQRLNDLLNMADIHLLPQKLEVADLVMPSKLINMVASGRPVVAGANPGTEIFEVASACGVVVEPENPSAMAQAVIDLANNPGERRRLGRVARAYATRNMNHDSILRNFEDSLYGLVRGGELIMSPSGVTRA